MTHVSPHPVASACCGLILGGAAGVVLGVHARADQTASPTPVVAVDALPAPDTTATAADPGPVRTNAAGQTYGSMLGREADPPDLVSWVSRDGTVGYVLRKEVVPDPPSSPEENARRTERARVTDGARTVPMYASDGVTVVGEAVLNTGWSVDLP